MCTISIGNLRYLYKFDLATAHKVALDLNANVNRKLFKSYKSNLYDLKYIKAYIQWISISPKQFTVPSLCGRLSTWVEYSDDIDRFIIEAKNESQDDKYIIPHIIGNPFRSHFYDTKSNPEEYIIHIIYCCILDTSIVDLNEAVIFFKDNYYTHPTRQHFSSHKNLRIQWEEFENVLKLKHAKPMPQGGSRPQTLKREETKSVCNVLVESLIAQSADFIINEKQFLNDVKTSMESYGKGQLYHISAAREFFRSDKRLEGHKPGPGRPSKNR